MSNPALSVFDPASVKMGGGQLFLAPYPAANPAAPSGSGATGTAVLSGGGVGSVTIGSGGTLYYGAPTVSFSGGGGTGAAGYATVSGGIVTSVVITNPGTGYTTPPTVAFTATPSTLLPDIIKGFFGLFYPDTKRVTLKTGVQPWAYLNSSGLKGKLKYDEVKFDPNDRIEEIIGYADTMFDGEVEFGDVNADKLADILSADSTEISTIAASTGQAGFTDVSVGGAASPQYVVAMYRSPSKKYAGQYDHVIIPRSVFKVDTGLEMDKKKAITVKVTLHGQGDLYLTSPNTSRPMVALYSKCTAQAQ